MKEYSDSNKVSSYEHLSRKNNKSPSNKDRSLFANICYDFSSCISDDLDEDQLPRSKPIALQNSYKNMDKIDKKPSIVI